MKSLPLCYYPTKLLIIDDDKLMLNSIKEIFSNTHYQLLSFSSAMDTIKFLNNYKPPVEHKQLLQSLISDENYGTQKHSPVDLDITALASISNNPQRHHEISVMIIDFNMPEINGFELAKICQNNCIKKILLTGKAAEKEAIDGFNSNLINRYVQKGNENTEEKLVNYTKELTFNYFQKLSSPLLLHLEANSKLPQSDLIFIDFFLSLAKQKRILEYYLIDKQGSYLCIDENGNRFYLVIHTNYSINNWLKLNEEENGLTEKQYSEIQQRKIIPFFGLEKEAWQVNKSEWSKYLHSAKQLIGSFDTYYWAIIKEQDV